MSHEPAHKTKNLVSGKMIQDIGLSAIIGTTQQTKRRVILDEHASGWERKGRLFDNCRKKPAAVNEEPFLTRQEWSSLQEALQED